MTHKGIFDLLKTLNIPVAYDHFDSNKQVNPPFIAYREISPDTFKADGVTYYRPYEFEIELVTEKKDVSLQNQLETLLTNNNIPYDINDEVWDEDEKIYHNYYEI
ncbi:MAG: hypothetical protein IKE63_00195 [Bacilli bacterium]|nr:hypothetical protein [Bacilli bacterium]